MRPEKIRPPLEFVARPETPSRSPRNLFDCPKKEASMAPTKWLGILGLCLALFASAARAGEATPPEVRALIER
jgi:hypothetical protein